MQKNLYPAVASYFLIIAVLLSPFWAYTNNLPVVRSTPKPAWLSPCKPYGQKPASRTIQNGYFFALAERQIDVEKQADYHHVIKEIVAEAGIQNGSQINVSFDPSYQQLEFHQITVWRNNQPQERLKISAFKLLADEEDFSKFVYQGSYSANYILDDIRKGDRIEYAYTITGENPVFEDKYCRNIYMQWGQPIAHQYFSLVCSSNRKLNIKAFNGVVKPVVTDEKGIRRYVYEDFQVPPVRDADNAPGWYNAYAYIEVTEYSSWADVIKWALKVNPVATGIKGNLSIEIAKLKADAGNDKAKYFRSAVRVVQDEVRYMGIEIGEYSHRANRPEKVFDQRYGDCKDKSLLLVSMLRANGIAADMVLANTEVKGKIDQLLPTTDAFNHAVVVAEVSGKQVWIDATMADQGGTGTDIYFPEYGKGLRLKAGNTGLVVIPPAKTGKIASVEEFAIPDEKGKVKLNVKTVYTLNEADDMRDRIASKGIGPTEKDYLKFYSKTYPKIEFADTIKVIDNKQQNELTTIEKYLIPDFFKRDTVTGKYKSSFYAGSINDQLPNFNNENPTPVSVNYPCNIDFTTRVLLPGGWNATDTHYEIKRDAYHFKDSLIVDGDTLTLRYQFAYLADYIPVSKRDQFRQDIKEISDNQLGFDFSYNPHPDEAPSPPLNSDMILFAMILFGLSLGLGAWLYCRETPGIVFSYGASFQPLGGWLMLVMIGLVVMTFILLGNLAAQNFFTLSSWNGYQHKSVGSFYRILLVFEAAGNIIMICYTVFCLVLLLNKRDILPSAITGYFIFIAVFYLVDYLLKLSTNGFADVGLYHVVLSLLAGAAGIYYFKTSPRVEDTFIVPYPHSNYSYEGPGVTDNK